jgi:hypothetical protein
MHDMLVVSDSMSLAPLSLCVFRKKGREKYIKRRRRRRERKRKVYAMETEILIWIPPVVSIVGMTRLLLPVASEARELLLGERVSHLRP